MRVTIFSTGWKFPPVSIFTYLHALILVACCYALLIGVIQQILMISFLTHANKGGCALHSLGIIYLVHVYMYRCT